ncbi:MAG: hypothetical protein R3F62_26850 [Planctomycetota bacterium]
MSPLPPCPPPAAPPEEVAGWTRHAWAPGALLGLALGFRAWAAWDTRPALAFLTCSALASYAALAALAGLIRGDVEPLGLPGARHSRAAAPRAFWLAVLGWAWGALVCAGMVVGVLLR